MATKSVIEIDVLDEKFKSFVDAFEKYQSALKKMPSDWQKVNAASSNASASVSKNIGQAAKNQKDLNKALKDSAGGFSNMAKLSGTIASNLASAALSVAKWTAYSAIGGYAAMTGLSARASSMRSQAQGLGISTGSLRSANVNLGRFINPEGVLGGIADVQSDLSKSWILSSLGGKRGQDPADMLGTVITSAVKQFKAGGQTKQYAETMGLTDIFSMEELRRLSSLTEEELQKTIKAYQRDRELLAVSDENSRRWQEFWVQVKRSSNELEKSLLNNLVKLTPYLEKFTNQMFKLVDEALGNDALAQGIEKFTSFLGSQEFKDNAKFFIGALKDLGEGLVTVLRKLGLLPDDKNEEINKAKKFQGKLAQEQYDAMTPEQKKFFTDPRLLKGKDTDQSVSGKIGTISERQHNPGNLRAWGNAPVIGGFASFSSDEEGLRAMAAQLKLYQSRDKLNTLESIISKYAPASENDTATYIRNAVTRSGFGAKDQLDLNDINTLSKIMSAMTKQENARSNFTPEVIFKAIVSSSAGSDLNVAGVQLK